MHHPESAVSSAVKYRPTVLVLTVKLMKIPIAHVYGVNCVEDLPKTQPLKLREPNCWKTLVKILGSLSTWA